MGETLGYQNKQQVFVLRPVSAAIRTRNTTRACVFSEDSGYIHTALSDLSQRWKPPRHLWSSVTSRLNTAQSPPGDAHVPRSLHYSCPVWTGVDWGLKSISLFSPLCGVSGENETHFQPQTSLVIVEKKESMCAHTHFSCSPNCNCGQCFWG